MTREEFRDKKSKDYRKHRESYGIKDPVYLDEIEEAYYQGMIDADKYPHWISVKDELPPLNQDVLVCSVINQDNAVAAVAIDRIIQNIEDNGYADWELYTDITHWMPLPSIEHLRETTKMIEKGGEK